MERVRVARTGVSETRGTPRRRAAAVPGIATTRSNRRSVVATTSATIEL